MLNNLVFNNFFNDRKSVLKKIKIFNTNILRIYNPYIFLLLIYNKFSEKIFFLVLVRLKSLYKASRKNIGTFADIFMYINDN